MRQYGEETGSITSKESTSSSGDETSDIDIEDQAFLNEAAKETAKVPEKLIRKSSSSSSSSSKKAKAKKLLKCVECKEQEYDLSCLICEENYCNLCALYIIHRTGKRRHHTFVDRNSKEKVNYKEAKKNFKSAPKDNGKSIDNDINKVPANKEQSPFELNVDMPHLWDSSENSDVAAKKKRILSRSKYVPMRLNFDERKELRLLEAALNVSEYVDKVDILSYSSKAKRIVAQLKEICAILSGLQIASDMKKGQELLENREFVHHAHYYQHLFEIGRRYKIMNPDRMRSDYGKMMYMVQDSMNPEIERILGFNLYKPILTVWRFLEKHNLTNILEDDSIVLATQEISSENKPRNQVQQEIRKKEAAIERICKKYLHKSHSVNAERLRQCIYSIGDNESFLRSNRNPIEDMQELLHHYFDSEKIDKNFSLAISSGIGGARLAHSHSKQFHYVDQSLSLWKLIMDDMFLLWSLADADLLNPNSRYRLVDTGQGLNRMQSCPKISKAMHSILARAQSELGSWIGSSAIHLGDHNVPNALMFIDKYLQVPRILNPLVLAIRHIEILTQDPFILSYIHDAFGGVEKLKKIILCDFFKFAFDGSGADSFYDAGSCIDGRLTSSWNWANQIEKKPYYRLFLMTGFTSFDGSGI